MTGFEYSGQIYIGFLYIQNRGMTKLKNYKFKTKNS
jgi:hypothetical protein